MIRAFAQVASIPLFSAAAITLSSLWNEYSTGGHVLTAIVFYPLFLLVSFGRLFSYSWIEISFGVTGTLCCFVGLTMWLIKRNGYVPFVVGVFLISLNVLRAEIEASGI